MKLVLFFLSVFIVLLHYSALYSLSTDVVIQDGERQCFNATCGLEFNPYSPLINCSYVPADFVSCDQPVDHDGNVTARDEMGYGCIKFGGQKYQEVAQTHVLCEVLEGIECYGDRQFLSLKEYPCIKYTGHKFVSTLIYSVLLGFLGMDRFCLGHTGTAVGKLLTLGGFGVWWVVDVILLVLGELRPADDSNWEPYY